MRADQHGLAPRALIAADQRARCIHPHAHASCAHPARELIKCCAMRGREIAPRQALRRFAERRVPPGGAARHRRFADAHVQVRLRCAAAFDTILQPGKKQTVTVRRKKAAAFSTRQLGQRRWSSTGQKEQRTCRGHFRLYDRNMNFIAPPRLGRTQRSALRERWCWVSNAWAPRPK